MIIISLAPIIMQNVYLFKGNLHKRISKHFDGAKKTKVDQKAECVTI